MHATWNIKLKHMFVQQTCRQAALHIYHVRFDSNIFQYPNPHPYSSPIRFSFMKYDMVWVHSGFSPKSSRRYVNFVSFAPNLSKSFCCFFSHALVTTGHPSVMYGVSNSLHSWSVTLWGIASKKTCMWYPISTPNYLHELVTEHGN